MATFVFRINIPRPDFRDTLTDDELAVMEDHAKHWDGYLNAGRMLMWARVVDDTATWGLGIIEGRDEEEHELRAFAARDPAVANGLVSLEFGKVEAGDVRTAEAERPS